MYTITPISSEKGLRLESMSSIIHRPDFYELASRVPEEPLISGAWADPLDDDDIDAIAAGLTLPRAGAGNVTRLLAACGVRRERDGFVFLFFLFLPPQFIPFLVGAKATWEGIRWLVILLFPI